MGKVVEAVAPFIYKNGINFKYNPYKSWKEIGGKVASAHYPTKQFNWLAHKIAFPSVFISKKEARLRFMEACSMNYDAFPDYIRYEIIPLIWDCWPQYDDTVVKWLKRYNVKACVFTCEEAAVRIQKHLPEINLLVITEGIDTGDYGEGPLLKDRPLDVYYFGRAPEAVFAKGVLDGMSFKWGGSNEEFHERIKNAKITNAFPQCDVNPKKTGGQETLTQRYWECMLSRIVMVGHAPKELTNLIGYNPVIELNVPDEATYQVVSATYRKQIKEILSHVEDYQSLVNKNRETALILAPWKNRMKQIMGWLSGLGYEI